MRRAATWIGTALLTLVAFYGIVVPALAWFEGAYNVAQGPRYANVAIFVVMGLVAPGVFLTAWIVARKQHCTRPVAYWYACTVGSVVGFPLFIVRLFFGGGF